MTKEGGRKKRMEGMMEGSKVRKEGREKRIDGKMEAKEGSRNGII